MFIGSILIIPGVNGCNQPLNEFQSRIGRLDEQLNGVVNILLTGGLDHATPETYQIQIDFLYFTI